MLYASHGPVNRMPLGGLDRYYQIGFNSRLQTTSIQFGTNASPSAYLALTDGYATSANNGNVHPLTVRNLSDYNAANNRLTTLTGIWNYDAAGKLTKHGGWTLAYDSLKRVTAIKRFVNSSGVWVEQPCQEVSYAYDANPDTGATYNLRGRLARVVAGQCDSVITSYSRPRKPGGLLPDGEIHQNRLTLRKYL